MKILMIDSIANVGVLLKKGLERHGHEVVFVHNPTVFDDDCGIQFSLQWDSPVKRFGDGFDVVHIHSPNLKKWLAAYPYIRSGVPLICHWHGSDLRVWTKSFPVKNWFIHHADMNIYSTLDLAWWIQKVPRKLLNCPVDTEVFKPGRIHGSGTVTFNGGGKSFQDHRILHKEMPSYLQKFDTADIHNDTGEMSVDDGIFSVMAFECAACGLIVEQFPWMDRTWVLQNASIPVITIQLEQIYNEVTGL